MELAPLQERSGAERLARIIGAGVSDQEKKNISMELERSLVCIKLSWSGAGANISS